MQQDRAPFFRRVATRIIDLLFSLIVVCVVAIPIVIVETIVLTIAAAVLQLPDDDRYALGFNVGFATAGVCYVAGYVGLELFLLARRGGQTLGKGLMGLRVIPSDTTPSASDARLSLTTAAIRMTVIIVPFVLMIIAGSNPGSTMANILATVGFLSLLTSLALIMLPTARRQAIHDLGAQTRVVRATKRNVHWRQDARMMVPGKIDMVKQV